MAIIALLSSLYPAWYAAKAFRSNKKAAVFTGLLSAAALCMGIATILIY